jgi:hypothetical protein
MRQPAVTHCRCWWSVAVWKVQGCRCGRRPKIKEPRSELANNRGSKYASGNSVQSATDWLPKPQLYFSAVATLVKVVLSDVPSVPTTVMIATEMPAAIRPYSMAVAPRSSVRKFFRRFLCAPRSFF